MLLKWSEKQACARKLNGDAECLASLQLYDAFAKFSHLIYWFDKLLQRI